MSLYRPYTLICELTYRCPLQCVYCSNPLDWQAQPDALDDADWHRVLREAAELGVVHAHFTGGEPLLRPGLEEMIRVARAAGLYTNLITSGIGLSATKMTRLVEAGLEHVQLSLQGSDADTMAQVARLGAHDKKLAAAVHVRAAGLSLTLNVVLHRLNIHQIDDLIDLALEMGARRLELANTQYYAWALKNRAALLPRRAQLDAAEATVLRRRPSLAGRLELAFVKADYYSDRPKRCMDGWARRTITLSPRGEVLPCHAARVIPHLVFENVRDRPLADIWSTSAALNAYRGDAWMPESCRTCPGKEADLGGCRCQAYLLTGDAGAADPVCGLAPGHGTVLAAVEGAQAEAASRLVYRTG